MAIEIAALVCEIYLHTQSQILLSPEGNIASTSVVRKASMLILLVLGNKYKRPVQSHGTIREIHKN
jgi:hypothetical protein